MAGRDRIAKLRALERDPAASTSERATAKAIADRLEKKSGVHRPPPHPSPSSPPPSGPNKAKPRPTGPTGFAEDYVDALWGKVRASFEQATTPFQAQEIVDSTEFSATEGARGLRFTVVIPYAIDDLSAADQTEALLAISDQLCDVMLSFQLKR